MNIFELDEVVYEGYVPVKEHKVKEVIAHLDDETENVISDSENSNSDENSGDSSENGYFEKYSDTSSIYSTDNPDIIHQRKKEKILKLKSIARAVQLSIHHSSVEHQSTPSINKASVGTSKISRKSFRAQNNLMKLILPTQPYNKKKEDDSIKAVARANQEMLNVRSLKSFAKTWRKNVIEARNKQEIRLQPTYRMEPTQKLRNQEIFEKCKSTLEHLMKKNNKYDPTFSPKFLKIATEIIKKDIKQFAFERYKIIVHLSLVKKVTSQSFQIVSACLWNEDDDKKIFFKLDTETYYLLCHIFLIYRE